MVQSGHWGGAGFSSREMAAEGELSYDRVTGVEAFGGLS